MEVKLIECPRDAMQGIKEFIPTEVKAAYINAILKCNFDTVDFGSFVSPKVTPQMRDTADLLKQLDLNSSSKLLAIVANERGAEDAVQFDEITYLGFPFSISEKFQQRNTNSSIEESLHRVEAIQNLALKHKKQLVVYLSMGFGNPYGEHWDAELVIKWCERLYKDLGITIQALSDTIGCATTDSVDYLFKELIPAFPRVEFGAHMHTLRENAESMIQAAYNAGCRRFDGAIKGYGGCPMAKDDLTGNMPTEIMLHWFEKQGIVLPIDKNAFMNAMNESNNVFYAH
ncbi:hydroxymethylglutaryl-CoA lyase [Crocinitomicaceae bacterium CZZ-1]|uniref:Hydroxymethylglutaryl-CoA lyase n=1 Tax=Taishania pollutisoli TaxID=2766479 RepID=A0A8J6PK44_9FLAO|nr:hydroxymethylglutaryl-CoA lyase [Taishania pollutisoli]MBC9813266.1 hydroxymethylglutaryl-CoA lyase [Taishania pollutisoli]MBX2948963.1 hydroxymethylglutaryl-CoA lyase [Crocinitomicaceae bacterium]NGF76992.1 hydroxymethylglutaryl-CoA lyase [Fluviicola sp. SGL-29]